MLPAHPARRVTMDRSPNESQLESPCVGIIVVRSTSEIPDLLVRAISVPTKHKHVCERASRQHLIRTPRGLTQGPSTKSSTGFWDSCHGALRFGLNAPRSSVAACHSRTPTQVPGVWWQSAEISNIGTTGANLSMDFFVRSRILFPCRCCILVWFDQTKNMVFVVLESGFRVKCSDGMFPVREWEFVVCSLLGTGRAQAIQCPCHGREAEAPKRYVGLNSAHAASGFVSRFTTRKALWLGPSSFPGTQTDKQ